MRRVVLLATGFVVLFLMAAALAVPQPTVKTITFSKTILVRGFTLSVEGTVVVDAASKTVSGAVTATVTDETGAVIAMESKTFSVVASMSTEVEQSLSIPAVGVTIHVMVDPQEGTATVTWTVNPARKY